MHTDELKSVYSGIKRGDHAKFKVLFDAYFPHLTYYACRFVDRDRAEDIVQDVFVWVWENKERVEMGDLFISFLYQSVYNKALNLIERDKMLDTKHAEIEIANKALEYYATNQITNDESEIDERLKMLMQAIENLPEKGRMCVKMSYLKGMKSKEIAEVMGISLRTVESHLHTSLKSLRKELLLLFIAMMGQM